MYTSGNTILITGGGSGIGRGLAHAFAELGNFVVVAGRREEALRQTVAGRNNMATVCLDVADANDVASTAAKLGRDYPKLNVLINNAGIMRSEDLTRPETTLATAEATVATNLLGPLRLTAALLPHLLAQPAATVINVSSGLAFVPLALTPTYCATKAALHSYSQSLRHQLRHSSVRVLELIPPYVQTELMDGKDDPMAMPLQAFLAETMRAFAATPVADELRVKMVDGLRLAEQQNRFAVTFKVLNEAREAAHQQKHASPPAPKS